MHDDDRSATLARLRARAESWQAQGNRKKLILIALRQLLADFTQDPEWLRPGARTSIDVMEESAVLLDRFLPPVELLDPARSPR